MLNFRASVMREFYKEIDRIIINTDSTFVSNSANTDVNNFVEENSDIDLPLLPDLEKYLGL